MADTSPVTVRVAGLLHKPWQRGSEWRAETGQVHATGATRAAAVEALNAAVQQVVDAAAERPAVVACQDGTMLVCYVLPDGCGYDIYAPGGARRGSTGMAGTLADAVLAAVRHARQCYGGEVALSGTWRWHVEREFGSRRAAEAAPAGVAP